MELEEIIEMIKRNKHSKHNEIIYIRDFLAISMEEAEKIYYKNFELPKIANIDK